MCMLQRKTKFRFRKKGSGRSSFVQLKWTFMRSNRYQTMNFFLEFVPMNLCTMGKVRLITDCRRNRKQGKRVYCQHMLHYGISGHFQALANVLKRRIKSVSPDTDQLTTWIFWCLPSNVFTSRRQTLKWSSCNSSIHTFMASCGMLMLLWRTVANTFGTEGNLCKPRWKLLKLLFRLTRILNIFTITCTKQLSPRIVV